MTVEELEKWLETTESKTAGWPKNAGEEGGESVGHDSGRKIVKILKENPNKVGSTETLHLHNSPLIWSC